MYPCGFILTVSVTGACERTAAPDRKRRRKNPYSRCLTVQLRKYPMEIHGREKIAVAPT
jgi:hypothetical protein